MEPRKLLKPIFKLIFLELFGSVDSKTFSPGFVHRLAAGFASGCIVIMNVFTGEAEKTLNGHVCFIFFQIRIFFRTKFCT